MMPTERIPLRELLPETGGTRMPEIARRIEAGAVFIYPTETIYGIGGRCDREEVFDRICSVKVRDGAQRMILLATDITAFSPLSLIFPPAALKCAEVFWPGPLTMVLTSETGHETTAVRVTDHPFLTALAPHFAVPLFSTSANVSGVPYNPDPEQILRMPGGNVDFMIDGGVLPVSPPSTIVRFAADGTVALLREGALPGETISAVVKGG